MTLGRVRVGFDQKVRVSGSGSGIVHIMVLRLILWSFCVIPFYARGQSKQMNESPGSPGPLESVEVPLPCG